MKDVAIATGANETLVVAAESPPDDGMHWGFWVLIVLGSLVGFGCVFLYIHGDPMELLEGCGIKIRRSRDKYDSESQSNSAAGAPGTVGNASKAKPKPKP